MRCRKELGRLLGFLAVCWLLFVGLGVVVLLTALLFEAVFDVLF